MRSDHSIWGYCSRKFSLSLSRYIRVFLPTRVLPVPFCLIAMTTIGNDGDDDEQKAPFDLEELEE